MDPFQFYPAPESLAGRMAAKFITSPFSDEARVLEPSAGDGALVRALVKLHAESDIQRHRRPIHVDFVEIDMSKHELLEDIEGVRGRVIGLDFLNFKGSLAPYTHILMNPPFNAGVHHVLKAWDGIFDGEIVALLNAETVKNPFSKERHRLVRLIELHGDVEYVQDAFHGDGVLREANVEVAIIHLVKKADINSVVAGTLEGLQQDHFDPQAAARAAAMHINDKELAIPGDVVEMTARAFDIAVKAMQEAVVAQVRADHAARLVGQTMAKSNTSQEDRLAQRLIDLVAAIRNGIEQGYAELKDRAWAEVLRSTKVSSKLSSKAIMQLEADFGRIKRLDFSAANVYAFLIGLIQSQGDMHLQMACDIFDEITQYHSDNTVWYMGWKSNDRHRTAGMRIKMTRFILPHFDGGWNQRLDYASLNRLADFDKVFEILDGKPVGSSYGLRQLFEQHASELAHGKRMASDYFEVRWYPGRGTIHFFPKRKDLIDRFNRIVGRARQWLPERDDMVSKDFWLAYERAEKLDESVRRHVASASTGWTSPFWVASKPAYGASEEARKQEALARIGQACLEAAKESGLDPLASIEMASPSQQQVLPLLAA